MSCIPFISVAESGHSRQVYTLISHLSQSVQVRFLPLTAGRLTAVPVQPLVIMAP
jgi:hypothetical protein